MVLQSQGGRWGPGPRIYTSPRRRRGNGLTRWALLLGVVAVVLGIVFWGPGGDEDPTETLASATSDPTTQQLPAAPDGASPGPANAGDATTPGRIPVPRSFTVEPAPERTPRSVDGSSPAAASSPADARPGPRSAPDPDPDPDPDPGARLAQVADAARRAAGQAEDLEPGADAREAELPGGADRVRDLQGLAADRTLSAAIAREIDQAYAQLEQDQLIEARARLSNLLYHRPLDLPPAEADRLRASVAEMNRNLVFSPVVYPGDPLAGSHRITQNDYLLSKIAPRYDVPHQLIQRINDIDPRRVRVGQTLKVLKGPFHAVVTKAEFRLDIYGMDDKGQPIYICSFPVGLGEADSTPVGRFRVRAGSKVTNPGYTHPRTGQVFERDDPENPVGEYWIGLEGIDDQTRLMDRYGIHGTIEPDTIGQTASMGCVRLLDDDIAWVYAFLTESESEVTIRP